MPVLYVAVGRRLGYPLKLVLAKAHVFCRWDDGAERFNIEGAGSGFSSHPDTHYHKWPKPLSPAEIKQGYYLKSLSSAQELAVFLEARGHCLLDNGRAVDAQVAYAHAHRLAPGSPDGLSYLLDAIQREDAVRLAAFAFRFGQGLPRGPDRQGYRQMPTDPLAELRRIEAINAENRARMERMAPPAVSHLPQAGMPRSSGPPSPGQPRPLP